MAGETSAALECAVCGHAPPPDAINSSTGGVCPNCGQPLAVYIFPHAFDQTPKAGPGDRLLDERESSCYYHPGKRAVRACDHCGRFVCALCELDMGGAHLCPQCVERGQHQPAEHAQREYFHYDTLALHLGFWPLFLIFPIVMVVPLLVTAPIIIYLVLRYWRARISAVPRPRWRFVFAALLAIGQLAAIALMMLTFMGVM